MKTETKVAARGFIMRHMNQEFFWVRVRQMETGEDTPDSDAIPYYADMGHGYLIEFYGHVVPAGPAVYELVDTLDDNE
jgi:hypothetical protein